MTGDNFGEDLRERLEILVGATLGSPHFNQWDLLAPLRPTKEEVGHKHRLSLVTFDKEPPMPATRCRVWDWGGAQSGYLIWRASTGQNFGCSYSNKPYLVL